MAAIRKLAVAALVACVVLLSLYALRRSPQTAEAAKHRAPPSKIEPAVTDITPAVTGLAPAVAAIAHLDAARTPRNHRPDQAPARADASKAHVLRMYREWAKYPPDSRPLTAEQLDVLEPFKVQVAPQRLVVASGNGGWEASNFECTLQPELARVAAGQAQTLTLTCRRHGEPHAEAVAVAVQHVRFEIEDQGRQVQLPAQPAIFRDDGVDVDETASDHVQTARLELPSSAVGHVRCRVLFEVLAEVEAKSRHIEHELVADFSATPEAPARFTAVVGERLEEGSLIVEVELDVVQPGRYRVYANLMKGDRPLAYAKQTLDLQQAGLRRVPLRFFGKILRDVNESGPYTVVAVRGERLKLESGAQAGAEALVQAVPPLTEPHVTSAYDVSAFSDAEWDSELKRERIAELSRQAAGE
jgi:hypothetical protein